MVPRSFHDFFGGCATISGALIGLLFVAISVSPGKLAGRSADADHQVKAGAAFSALVNTLVIALVALLPEANFGAAVVILSAAGLSSTAGLVILYWREHKARIRIRALVMLIALFVLYALQLVNGVELGGSPGSPSLISDEGVLVIGFFVFAIARAWELVGARDSRLLSTVAGLGHPTADKHAAASETAPEPPADSPTDRADPAEA